MDRDETDHGWRRYGRIARIADWAADLRAVITPNEARSAVTRRWADDLAGVEGALRDEAIHEAVQGYLAEHEARGGSAG